MTVMNLSEFFIWNIKGIDYRVYVSNIDQKDAVNILNNFKLSIQGVL